MSKKSSTGHETTATPVIIWFRRDLRLSNNPALNHALTQGRPVVALYIQEEEQQSDWQPGAASRWWCHHSLVALQLDLEKLGLRLHFFRGSTPQILSDLCRELRAGSVCWNRLYEPAEMQLEAAVMERIKPAKSVIFDSHYLFKPGTVLNQQDKPYRVFTPFWKTARSRLLTEGVSPQRLKTRGMTTKTMRFAAQVTLSGLGLLDAHPWHRKLERHWKPGEAQAQKHLRRFIRTALEDYATDRDHPAVAGTSKLSPYLHFGEITPAQIIHSLMHNELLDNGSASVERFITELGWREFAMHILWHYPASTHTAMNARFTEFWPRKASQRLLKAWQTGTTGIALVDAGMRELWETGWMHNRVRMIVGSFLTKNLGIHWWHGARWFWDTLVDADLASNSMGWQWVAGSGVDAAPYYRIFNPERQAERFDEHAEYQRRWLSDGHSMTTCPIVDLAHSREQALERYRLTQKE